MRVVETGGLEVHLVSDGTARLDAGGLFGLVPRALYQRHHQPAADNTLPSALSCLFVRSRGKTILVDTGMGDKLTLEDAQRAGVTRPDGGLLQALARVGVSPDDVDVVINTHLHSDHCGGNTRREGDRLVAAYPRATYWVQRIEWAEASQPDARTRGTYRAENFAPLMAEGRVRLLHGDTEVTDQVRCVVTRGHTRAHQSLLLQAGEWSALYVGDMVSYAIHMANTAWLTAFDVEPLENIRTKEQWQRWAIETGGWLIFEHDQKTPVARLVKRGGRLAAEPIG
jgi:glyoxylase-like metal-dependent hydrolase (beta-lactamase superfamily II)